MSPSLNTSSSALPRTLVLAGVGKMGGAMLRGWLEAGLDPAGVTVLDPNPSQEIWALCAGKAISLNPAAPTLGPEVLVLAIKPQALAAAAAPLDALLAPNTLVLSILAGKTIGDLCLRLPRAQAVVRAMPNLPASIGRGATGATASMQVSEDQRRMAETLLSANGIVEWVASEDLIDAVTAVSGSGPAYVFHLTECLAQAGIATGLPPELAERLARATVTGSGELLHRSDLSPAALRQAVTSPGGTTEAALQVLMAEPGGLPALMREAVAAAKRRAKELAG